MDSGKEVFDVIQAIASTSKRTEKEALLKAAKCDLMARVLKAAYDPFVNYGLSHCPAQETEGSFDLTGWLFWDTLKAISSREVTGNEALQKIKDTMDCLDKPSSEVFRRIVNKDMKAGFSESTINKIFPKLLPEFPYMRSSLPEKSNVPHWDWGVGIYCQKKADGMFVNTNLDDYRYGWVTTRNGTLFPDPGRFKAFSEAFSRLACSSQTHGEVTVLKDGVLLDRKTGNGLLNSLLQGGDLPEGHTLHLEVWDQIGQSYVQPKGRCNIPYKTRLGGLHAQLEGAPADIQVIPTEIVYSKAGAMNHYRKMLAAKLEGAMWKHPELPWADTGSSGHKDQVKMKLTFEVELKVVDLIPGKPGAKTEDTFGSLLCRSECGLLEVGVSGLTDKDRARGRDWLGAIVSVQANDLMVPKEGAVNPLHSLFLPRFGIERLDRSEADTLERIKELRELAISQI